MLQKRNKFVRTDPTDADEMHEKSARGDSEELQDKTNPTVGSAVSKAKQQKTNMRLMNVSAKRMKQVAPNITKSVSTFYEDVEGLLTTLGVISALLLTLQIQVFCAVPMQEWKLNEYRTSLIYNFDFRVWVNKKLYEWDPQFQPIRDVGLQDGPFNITDALLNSARPEDLFPSPGTSYDPSLLALDIVFHLTASKVNIDEVYVYSSLNPCDFKSLVQARFIGSGINGFTTVMFTLAFAGSIFLYIALSLSDARTHSGKGSWNFCMDEYNKIAIPLIASLYACLIVGVLFFFYGVVSLMQFRNPSWFANVDW